LLKRSTFLKSKDIDICKILKITVSYKALLF
jgi:hypothetical protein